MLDILSYIAYKISENKINKTVEALYFFDKYIMKNNIILYLVIFCIILIILNII